MSFEYTKEPCWARPIDEVVGACAASPACKACRFRTSLRANGEHTDDAEVLRPTPGEAEAVWPTPPAPPSQGGEKKAARAQQKRSFGGRLFNPVNTNFAPRHLLLPLTTPPTPADPGRLTAASLSQEFR